MPFYYWIIAFYLLKLAWKGFKIQHQQEVKRHQKSVRFKYTDEEINAIFDKYKR